MYDFFFCIFFNGPKHVSVLAENSYTIETGVCKKTEEINPHSSNQFSQKGEPP